MKRLQYIIILLTLLSFGTVINQVGGITPVLDLITMAICIYLIISRRFYIKPRYWCCLGGVWLLAFISMGVTHTSISYYVGFFFHTFLAVLIIAGFNYDFRAINDSIFNVTRLICYLGVINIFLYSFTPSLFSDVPSKLSNARTIFYLFNYLPSSDVFVRNQGIFWEPGVFQIVLNLHLYNILIEREYKIKKAIIPILLIISTLSTTGLVVMVVILAYWLLKKNSVKFSPKYFFVALVIGAILIPFVYSNIQEKIENPHGSAALRAFDYYMGVEVIKNEPMWGIGMNPEAYIKRTTAVDMDYYDVTRLEIERGNTNSFVSVAVMFGIPFALLFMLSLFKQNIFTKKRLIGLLFFLVLLSEPLFGQLFIFIICFSSISPSSVSKTRISIKEMNKYNN